MQQVRYFKVISAFCKTMDKQKFKFHYQLQIVQRLFHYELNTPLFLGTQKNTQGKLRPYVYFSKMQG
jgi:hypothetical protein